MEIEQPVTLDILDTRAPALSTTSDMPVIETKPDSLPAPVEQKEPAVPSPEEGEEAEQLEESATSTTEEPGQPAKPRGVGKKIAELVKKAADAEARAKQLEENLNNALALQKQVEPKPIDEDPEPVKPSKDNYSDPDAYDQAAELYIEQKAAYTAKKQVEKALAEQEVKVQQAQAEESQRLVRETYNTRLETTKAKYADFEEVAQSPDVQVSMPVAHALMMMTDGPEIQYYLGQHREEAASILKMPYLDQLTELGVIRSKLSNPKPISNAPSPIKPLKTNTAPSVKTPEEESMEEYAVRRKKELRQMHH